MCEYGLSFNICLLFQLCAYNMRSGGFVRSGHFAGSFLKTNPLVSRHDNARDDLLYKDICCSRSDLCNLYYEVRPASNTCYSISPFILFGKTYFHQMYFVCFKITLVHQYHNCLFGFSKCDCTNLHIHCTV